MLFVGSLFVSKLSLQPVATGLGSDFDPFMQSYSSSLNAWRPSHRYVQLALVVLAIAGCVFAIRTAVIFGLSRVLVAFALVTGNATAANKAVELTPKDAEAHMANAGVLSLVGAPEKSLVELEKAVALRPADYRLWSEIGLVRDQIGDPAGAIRAFDEAVARAPHYSHPRWNRGNVLLRNRQYEAAFKDLNQAAQSNPDLVPGLLDLAWGIARGDVALTEQLVEFRNDKMRIAFARLLARQGRAAEAAAQLAQSGSVTDATKTELVDQLTTKGAYKEAFEIWKTFHSATGNAQPPLIYDGGFERSLSFGEAGFGWRVPRDLQATSVSLDADRPHSGSQS
ncbi:MAG TPA: tetratricopeptide repeat protein, partial [Pyrinomonadaceae bacterium]